MPDDDKLISIPVWQLDLFADAYKRSLAGWCGWGGEQFIVALDDLTQDLEQPFFCTYCIRGGHRTWDHYLTGGSYRSEPFQCAPDCEVCTADREGNHQHVLPEETVDRLWLEYTKSP